MNDLDRQLRAYTEALDATAPGFEALAAARTGRDRRRGSRLALAVAGGAAAFVLVGGVAILSATRTDTGASDTTSTFATTTVTAASDQTTVTAPVLTKSRFVELVSTEPRIVGGKNGDIGVPMVDAGPILKVDGQYLMLFAAGGDGDTGWGTVYWATSRDGSSWSVAPDPVVMPDIVGAVDVMVGSLLHVDGGYVAYLHVAFDAGGHGAHDFRYSIERATAPSLSGPWEFDAEPVLLPSEEGWDSAWVNSPSVVRIGDEWRMYYAGASSDDDGDSPAIGVATSVDGISWTRRDAPIFEAKADSTWENGGVEWPTVVVDGDRLVMLYAGRTGGVRGLAVSMDGERWDRVDDAPILTPLDVPRPALFTTSIYNDEGILRLFLSNGGHRTTSDVYEMVLSVD